MDEKDERKRPLQDEAESRHKWRGGGTILARGGEGVELPASETDEAADSASEPASGRGPAAGLAGRMPPD